MSERKELNEPVVPDLAKFDECIKTLLHETFFNGLGLTAKARIATITIIARPHSAKVKESLSIREDERRLSSNPAPTPRLEFLIVTFNADGRGSVRSLAASRTDLRGARNEARDTAVKRVWSRC